MAGTRSRGLIGASGGGSGGSGSAADSIPAIRDRVMAAVRTDFGWAMRAVLLAVAVALAAAFVAALFHPGTRVTDAPTPAEPVTGVPSPAS